MTPHWLENRPHAALAVAMAGRFQTQNIRDPHKGPNEQERLAMTNDSKDSPSDREGASRGRAAVRALRSEPGPGPSPVRAPNVAPRGNAVAGRRRRRRSATTGAPSAEPAAFAAQRLAALAAKLAMRISAWGWLRTYERWKRGEAVTLFQRRWLAFSMRRLRGELRRVSHAEFIATAPWPAHGGDQ